MFSSKLSQLERLLQTEFRLLVEGDDKALGQLLFEKLRLVESLQGEELDESLLRRCQRMNRDLIDILGVKKPLSTYAPPS